MVAQAEQGQGRQGQGHSVADEVMTDPIVRREPLLMHDPHMGEMSPRRDPQIRRPPSGSGLYDVLDLILDKGIVIDAFVRVSLVGIELLTVDARVVIASVDTYLRYAEAAERLQLYQPRGGEDQLPDMMGMSEDQGGVGGQMLKHGAKKLKQSITADGGKDDDESNDRGDQNEGVGSRVADGVRHVLTRGIGRFVERVSGQERDDSRDPPTRYDRGNGRSSSSGRTGGGRTGGGGRKATRPRRK